VKWDIRSGYPHLKTPCILLLGRVVNLNRWCKIDREVFGGPFYWS
jgi:hypothetical protein